MGTLLVYDFCGGLDVSQLLKLHLSASNLDVDLIYSQQD